jgi:predicted dehydrogenase
MSKQVARRDFLAKAASVSALLAVANKALASAGQAKAPAIGKVLGANDRINLGIIGVGGRGSSVGRSFNEFGKKNNNFLQILAVCDVYEKRKKQSEDYFKKQGYETKGYLDWNEVIARKDLDAVIVATPDHWHAKIALAAMNSGKDVYLEKPMCHTTDEARQLIDTVKKTGRLLQVGSQTTSADQWYKAKKAIADGMIGPMIMSQGSYHRNSLAGEWNYPIDKEASPEAKGENYIDWKTWVGPAAGRPWDADRFFRFRKYWDYSGGIATDLFYHVAAPLNICWSEPQFPYKVMAGGGIYGGTAFQEKREVPDTFHLIAEYAKGHSLVLSSSMANSQHIPGLIRGHHGTIVMVEHGMFERTTDYISVRPEVSRRLNRQTNETTVTEIFSDYKFGKEEIRIPVDNKVDMMTAHISNFLQCMRTREKPHLDVETGAKAQVLITLAVQSYRQGKVLYWDEKRWKAVDRPPKA